MYHVCDFIQLRLFSSSFSRLQWRWCYLPLGVGGRANQSHCTCHINVTDLLLLKEQELEVTSRNCREQKAAPRGQRWMQLRGITTPGSRRCFVSLSWLISTSDAHLASLTRLLTVCREMLESGGKLSRWRTYWTSLLWPLAFSVFY